MVLATSVLFLVAMVSIGPAAGAQSGSRASIELRTHQHHPKHTTTKHKNQTKSGALPCLEGTWNVTSLTLATSGLTFTGGAGTTVNIMSNGNAVGDFTPGAPLTGTEGSAKFNGTITDHYGFSPKTTARSGTFPVTPVSNNATITIAGVTRPVTSTDEQGSYSCSGKDLSLKFTSGASTLTYQLAPAG